MLFYYESLVFKNILNVMELKKQTKKTLVFMFKTFHSSEYTTEKYTRLVLDKE